MATGSLIVRRKSDLDIKMRALEVHIDGEWRVDLMYGGEVQFDLPAGEHELMVTNRLTKERATFVLSEGQTMIYDGANVVTKGLSALLASLGMVMYRPTLRRAD